MVVEQSRASHNQLRFSSPMLKVKGLNPALPFYFRDFDWSRELMCDFLVRLVRNLFDRSNLEGERGKNAHVHATSIFGKCKRQEVKA